MESTSKITVGVHCLKLRTKSMYLQTAVEPAGQTFYDEYNQTAWWCVLTQTALGPDRQPVGPESCCDGRDCCML
jgi:hypothetical protein